MPAELHLRRLLGPDDIADGFERSIGSPEKYHVVVFERTDPLEFRQVKLHFMLSQKLGQIDVVVGRENCQSIRLGNAPDVIRSRHGSLRPAYLDHDVPGFLVCICRYSGPAFAPPGHIRHRC